MPGRLAVTATKHQKHEILSLGHKQPQDGAGVIATVPWRVLRQGFLVSRLAEVVARPPGQTAR